MDATADSFPGAHRVWDVDKRLVDRFSDIVSANPRSVPSTLDLIQEDFPSTMVDRPDSAPSTLEEEEEPPLRTYHRRSIQESVPAAPTQITRAMAQREARNEAVNVVRAKRPRVTTLENLEQDPETI